MRVQDLIDILHNGGGLDLNASRLTTQDIINIVSNASAGNQVILRGISGRPSAELIQIARNGSGRVTIEFV